jgi:hypothetical protein
MQVLRPDPMTEDAAQRLAATDPTLFAAPSKIFSGTDVRPLSATRPYYLAERGTPRETSLASDCRLSQAQGNRRDREFEARKSYIAEIAGNKSSNLGKPLPPESHRLDYGALPGGRGGFRPKGGGLCSNGRNSIGKCQLPKLDVAGSSPVSRSMF